MIRFKSYLLLLLALGLFMPGFSQETILHINEGSEFRRALDLFEKEKYSTAQQIFQQIAEDDSYSDSYERTQAEYYIACCAVRMFNEDAEYLTYQFAGKHPESPLVNQAYFNLADYFYARKRWRQAIEYYLKTDADQLSKDQWSEYYFKLGYSYFSAKDFDKAKPVFYRIKDVNTRYTPHALYYYSHIHYDEGNYQTALEGFLKLLNNRSFGSIAPYYVVQIYYKQGRFGELVDFAPGVMDQIADSRLDEVARITAEAFAQLGRYKESVPYYRTYLDSANYLRKEDKYQAGYAFYKAGEYHDAVSILEEISTTESELGQNAAYYLADCYLRMNDKEHARLAFQSASRSNFDPAIRQDALFNYALLCYELGNDPFNEAIRALEDFIQQYPHSNRIEEAYKYLIRAYLYAKNYHLALQSLEKSDMKSPELRKAYQRIAFFRGVELFNNVQYPGAVIHFDKSLKYGDMDQALKAKALYWKAESFYKMNNFQDAINGYKAFKAAPIAYTLPEYDKLEYNIGYAWFKTENYGKAIESFRKFASEAPARMAEEKSDALLRVGDCFFAQSDYYAANDYYNRASQQGAGADYAVYQKALCEGLENRDVQKIQVLQQLIQTYPGSTYKDDAYFEMAQSFLKIQNGDRAIETLKSLIEEMPQSPLAPNAMVQLGLLHFNRNENDQAIRYYKQTISRYGGTQSANEALRGLRNIYVQLDRVDEYVSYANSQGSAAPMVTMSEQDSLSYVSAEKLYLAGNCKESSTSFARYISNYPRGSFLLNAHFYKADCDYQQGAYDEALKSFRFVLDQPQNMFTEHSLLTASRIEFLKEDYQNAIRHYEQLASVYSSPGNVKEARISIMKAYFQLKNYDEALKASRSVTAMGQLPPETLRQASYIAARSLEEGGRDVLALEEYQKISGDVSSEEGTEAKFKVAEINFKRGNLEKADQEIREFVKMSPSYEYWVGRTFILWADLEAANKKYSRAVQKLQSIIDGYEKSDDGILDMARERKTRYVAMIEANEQPQEDEAVEIKDE
ncbi:MAG: tetratricopeptide repeat protein [Bacteroidales bacterium]|nr:tetratricopeptide repeat protein [Bacteroidales bacterium]